MAFFWSGEKAGTSKKKLSSEVGGSQCFCSGSLRSLFPVDCDPSHSRTVLAQSTV